MSKSRFLRRGDAFRVKTPGRGSGIIASARRLSTGCRENSYSRAQPALKRSRVWSASGCKGCCLRQQAVDTDSLRFKHLSQCRPEEWSADFSDYAVSASSRQGHHDDLATASVRIPYQYAARLKRFARRREISRSLKVRQFSGYVFRGRFSHLSKPPDAATISS